MKLEISRQIYEKSLNIKFYENLSRESGIVPLDGWTEEQTDVTKLTVAFRNFAKSALKETKVIR